jgi:hypothetical protein
MKKYLPYNSNWNSLVICGEAFGSPKQDRTIERIQLLRGDM